MEKEELYLKVLKIAQDISDFGPDMVNALNVTEKKRLYSMIVEAFRSFSAFSRLAFNGFLVQSSAVLRLFVEETAKITILVERTELYDLFVKHSKVREDILDLSQKERKQKVIQEFQLSDNQYSNALSYLDYGWIKSANKNGKYGYHEMLKLAYGENSAILVWVDHLDQFIHQNVDSLSLTDNGFKELLLENIYLSCLTFEKLYVSFHNLIGKGFTINGKKMFEDEFWPLYEKILKPEDLIN